MGLFLSKDCSPPKQVDPDLKQFQVICKPSEITKGYVTLNNSLRKSAVYGSLFVDPKTGEIRQIKTNKRVYRVKAEETSPEVPRYNMLHLSIEPL
jgi:hypothetical protein